MSCFVQDIQFTATAEEEYQKMFTFKKLEWDNFAFFFLIKKKKMTQTC